MQHSVQANTTIFEAFNNGDAHARSVVDDGKVIGILLMRDVIAKAAAGVAIDSLTAGELMHEQLVTITDTRNKLAMARKFAEHHIKSLVVCDPQGRYLRDLDPPEAIANLPSGLMGFFSPAERFMVRDPYDITADASMEEALKRLAEHHVSCLLVHDFTGETNGIISESDVMQWIIDGRPAIRVSERMSSPVACMPDQSNLMQVWNEMNALQVMKMVMISYDQSVSGLVTATDILGALSQSMLETFDRYHCPDDVDMMLEWHRGGMVMAVSDPLLQRLACTSEALVGLQWDDGLDETMQKQLLNLGANSELALQWKHTKEDGESMTLDLIARRDAEQPVMWWSLC